ncbi:putative DCG1-like protein [Peniophora sp. CONT]|nr:putative DCG1-like protein [Peniophora sp. CONT]
MTSTPFRLLVVNPNTSVSMTDALRPVVESVLGASGEVTFFTAPSPSSGTEIHPGALPSINSPQDCEASAQYVYPFVEPLIEHYDAFLVACYSEHPLVGMLGRVIQTRSRDEQPKRQRYVTGIFEASVLASLGVLAQLSPESAFGIISTGSVWETALADAVHAFLGADASKRFSGCRTTGMSALELHDAPAEVVKERMANATSRLLRDAPQTRVFCLGCAAMVDGADAIRLGAGRAFGDGKDNDIRVVDGVAAGVAWLVGACRTHF